VSHQAGVAGDYSTVTKVANVSTIRQGELLAKLKGSLSLLKISDESILAATKDAAGDEQQLVLSKKNLKLMERNDLDNADDFSQLRNAQAPIATEVHEVSHTESEPKQLNAKERRALRRQGS
jgi:hypothetical protein